MPILQFSQFCTFQNKPKWVDGGRVSGNLQTLGRMVAEIEPEWIGATCRAFN